MLKRHICQLGEQLGDVVGIARALTGKPRGIDAGRTIQCVDFDARIVRDGRATSLLGRIAGLQDCILNKGLAGLFGGDDPQRTLTHHREAGT